MANEETLADVITSIPDLLMKASALKQQSDMQDKNLQYKQRNKRG